MEHHSGKPGLPDVKESSRGRPNGVDVLSSSGKRQNTTRASEAPAEPPNSGPRCELSPVFLRSGGDGCSARGRNAAQRKLHPPGTTLRPKLKAIGGRPVSDSWGSRVLNRGFRRYVRRFVKSSFNSVRVSGSEHALGLPPGSVVVYVNHPGWWDPMAAVLFTDLLLAGRRFAAPMDAAALARYPVLEKLGFFPVERDSAAGAREFLRHSRRALADGRTALWITPAGRFHDVRESVSFQPGLSHLVDRDFGGSVLPVALEYVFWNERRPELLAKFGPLIECRQLPEERPARTAFFELRLAEQQAALAGLALERSGTGFEELLAGKGGIGGAYDAWRRLSCWLRGDRFDARHETGSEGVGE